MGFIGDGIKGLGHILGMDPILGPIGRAGAGFLQGGGPPPAPPGAALGAAIGSQVGGPTGMPSNWSAHPGYNGPATADFGQMHPPSDWSASPGYNGPATADFGQMHPPSNWMAGPGYNGPNASPQNPTGAPPSPPRPLDPPTGGWTGQYAGGFGGGPLGQHFEERRTNKPAWQDTQVVGPNDPNHPGVKWNQVGGGGQWQR